MQTYDYNRKQSLYFTHTNFQKLEIEFDDPRATFFEWLKRIGNKYGRSIRFNKFGALQRNEEITVAAKRGQISLRLKKLLDVIGVKGKQVYSFRHSAAATQLIVMGLDETLLNTYTGHARNSKSTNDYYEMPSCNIDKQVRELLTMISNKLVGMRSQQSFMGRCAHAVR
ncbi:MAG: hypothetical protein EZS28_016429 [Streblomastix strix]|uniref:Tyr recombinase domain-containing protein n=1 Tax=Streblomastix strix TaxID=222440 RepID=A0A5J4W096_9EUKA|nr:MAG: hypothetical protein EZS28_016429 [Streblomastix strix]